MKRSPSPFAVAAVLGAIALIALLAYGLGSTDPDRGIDRALARGERVDAPELRLERLGADGEGSLADYRGRVVVLNVWASWCKPCRAETPLLQRWHERISRRGRGTVLGVDVKDVRSDALAFAREFELTYPMLRDGDGDTLAKEYGVVGVPETVVIDARGRITAIARGPVEDGFMRRHVLPLLEERS